MKRVLGLVLVLALATGNVILARQCISANKQVEPYCAIAHQHDVDGYKACKAKSPTVLLQDLTQAQAEHNNFPLITLKPLD